MSFASRPRFQVQGGWLYWTAPADWEGKRLLKAWMEAGFPPSYLKQKAHARQLQLDRKPVSAQHLVRTDGRYRLLLHEPEEVGVEPEPLPLEVLYEDEHLLVVNKPAGMAVHPTHPDMRHTLTHAIAHYYHSQGLSIKVRPVHRIDQDTTGGLVVAKHRLSHIMMDELLREQRIRRLYVALVEGHLPQLEGTIAAPIGRDRHHPTRRRVSCSPKAKMAITHYRVLRQFAGESLLELRLETGRTHQIRVHMSHIGHPVVGDTLYGAQRYRFPRQALHATRLLFPHPLTGEQLEIEVPCPDDLLHFIRQLTPLSAEP